MTSTDPVARLVRGGTDDLAVGQRHEAAGDYSAALASYDAALATAPTPHAAALAHMNRGNVLQKLAATSSSGNCERERVAAIAAYDSAIAHLTSLPFATEPALRNSLGAAWLNRGHALLDHDTPAAITSLSHAIATLSPLPLDENIFYRRNLAGAHANLAHALLTTAPAHALSSAQSALALLATHDRAHADLAAISLRARRALVMSLGAAATPAQLSLATDALEDGLALARAWETRGFTDLRPLAARLFRLGAQLYRLHQPHFLAEFLLEHAASGPFESHLSFRAAALEAIDAALADLSGPQLLLAGTPATERLLATVNALRAARPQLLAPHSVSQL